MISIDRIKSDIYRLNARYNGDNDLIPGAPIVTYADKALLDMIEQLTSMVADLQDQIRCADLIESQKQELKTRYFAPEKFHPAGMPGEEEN